MVFNACVVAVRLFGIVVDGISPIQLTELRNEGLSWLLFVASLLTFPRKKSLDTGESVKSKKL